MWVKKNQRQLYSILLEQKIILIVMKSLQFELENARIDVEYAQFDFKIVKRV